MFGEYSEGEVEEEAGLRQHERDFDDGGGALGEGSGVEEDGAGEGGEADGALVLRRLHQLRPGLRVDADLCKQRLGLSTQHTQAPIVPVDILPDTRQGGADGGEESGFREGSRGREGKDENVTQRRYFAVELRTQADEEAELVAAQVDVQQEVEELEGYSLTGVVVELP